MNNIFRGLIAGYGAKKLGGGCLSTVLIFVVLWVLLGQCNAALPPDVGTHGSSVFAAKAATPDYRISASRLTFSPIAVGMANR